MKTIFVELAEIKVYRVPLKVSDETFDELTKLKFVVEDDDGWNEKFNDDEIEYEILRDSLCDLAVKKLKGNRSRYFKNEDFDFDILFTKETIGEDE